MENQINSTDSTNQGEQNFIPPPTPSPLPKRATQGANQSKILWLSAFIAIILGITGLVIYQVSLSPKPVQESVLPTPTSTPTPTPTRLLSIIATQSAFTALDARVASLSASLRTESLEDPSLSPPVLDLPLGFSN